MAQVQLVTIEGSAYDNEGHLVHPRLLERYQRRATTIVAYAERPEHYSPALHAHFDVVLAAIATGRANSSASTAWATSTTRRCTSWNAISISRS